MTEPAANQFALLRTRRFLPLFLVQFLGAFNDQVYKNAFVALLTFRLADELTMSLSLLNLIAGALFILPFALFAPTAGLIADGMDKARMMRFVKLSELCIMGVAVVAYHTQNLFLLYFVLFLMGAQSAAFAPIKYAVLPQYLRDEELVGGNGLVQAATFLAILGGTVAGFQLVLTEWGVTVVSVAVIAISGAGYAAACAAPPAPPLGAAPKVDWVFPRAMWRLVASCTDQPAAFRAILAIAWFWFVGATFLTLLPAYAKEELGVNDDVVTLLLAAFSVGVALGALMTEWMSRGEVGPEIAPIGAVGLGVFSVVLWSITPALPVEGAELLGIADFLGTASGWPVLIVFICLAASAGLYVTPLNAVLQHEAPPARRSQFIACSNVVDSGLMVLSSILAAVLVLSGFSVAQILGMVGGSGVVMALLVARYAPGTAYGRLALRVWPRGPI
ncbi:MAG: MFS transporter [Pseudomonadota bacterium]